MNLGGTGGGRACISLFSFLLFTWASSDCKEKQIYCNRVYCKTLSICGNKFSRFSDNDIMAYFNSGSHDIPWLQIVKKT